MESKLGPLGTSATNWPIVPDPDDCEDREFGVIKIRRGNRSTRRKPASALPCSPQISLDYTRARTRAAAVGSQKLTAWAMTWPIFLTSALVRGEWSASCPGHFTPGEIAPCTHWVGGSVGPRAGLDDVEKRNFLTLPELELRPLGRPARSQSLCRLRYSGSYHFT
jgi:hypothetical protein